MRKSLLLAFLCIGSLMVAGSAGAAGYNWNYHQTPFTFLFGNHIDTHLATMLNSDGTLSGRFYVVRVTDDNGVGKTTAEGIPVFRHCMNPSDYDECQAGWDISAYPCVYEINGCTAMFLYIKHDHPVWLIGPRERTMMNETFLTGDRNQVPQPGRPTHYHWLTRGSSTGNETFTSTIADLEKLFHVKIYVDTRCNVAMAEQLTPGVICPGYFLELTAKAVSAEPPTNAGPQWAWQHAEEAIILSPGPDMRTHINYVTSYVAQDIPTDALPYPPK